MINIEGLNKAEVLAELYNNAKAQGMGIFQYIPEDMTIEEAQAFLDHNHTYFDYVYGRVMKVDLKSDTEFSGALYDRDNGEGKAQRVVDYIRRRRNL